MEETIQGQGISLRFDPDTRAVLVNVEADPQTAPIDEAWLREHLAEGGWAALQEVPGAFIVVLSHYNQHRAVADLRVAECADARMAIRVSPDGQLALLDIVPAKGGENVTSDAVLTALASQGIREGIMFEEIAAAVAAGTAQGVPIAHARAPVPGKDGWLESLLPAARSRVPQIDAHGHVDYRDLGAIPTVHAGDVLMRCHEPTAGVPGMTLLGAPIPAKSGKPMCFATRLEGAAPATEDPGLLVATSSGQPVEVRGGMVVEPVFTVEAVDASTGNIRFDGCVVVKGDVQVGMTVQATGDIEVGGVVEAATLDAGGNIVIRGGAVGGLSHPEKYCLRAGASVYAGYLSQTRVEAGDSIFVDDTVMQCDMLAINCISVGKTRRGHIIGGRAQATLSISAKVIGSPSRVTTRFEIGINPVMHKELKDIIRSREEHEAKLAELVKVFEFDRHNPGKLPAAALDKARNTAGAITAEIEALREQQTALEQKTELAQQACLMAEQRIHEGVDVSMGGRHYLVTTEHGPCSIGLNDEDMLGFV